VVRVPIICFLHACEDDVEVRVEVQKDIPNTSLCAKDDWLGAGIDDCAKWKAMNEWLRVCTSRTYEYTDDDCKHGK
jgi:hypothetical protein